MPTRVCERFRPFPNIVRRLIRGRLYPFKCRLRPPAANAIPANQTKHHKPSKRNTTRCPGGTVSTTNYYRNYAKGLSSQTAKQAPKHPCTNTVARQQQLRLPRQGAQMNSALVSLYVCICAAFQPQVSSLCVSMQPFCLSSRPALLPHRARARRLYIPPPTFGASHGRHGRQQAKQLLQKPQHGSPPRFVKRAIKVLEVSLPAMQQ